MKTIWSGCPLDGQSAARTRQGPWAESLLPVLHELRELRLLAWLEGGMGNRPEHEEPPLSLTTRLPARNDAGTIQSIGRFTVRPDEQMSRDFRSGHSGRMERLSGLHRSGWGIALRGKTSSAVLREEIGISKRNALRSRARTHPR